METMSFSQAIYKKGAIVIIQKKDGTKIEGYVIDNDGETLYIGENLQSSSQIVTIQTLKDASYLYVGLPIEHTETEVSVQIRTNGILEESNSILMVNDGHNKWSVKNRSRKLPTNEMLKQLACKDVLFVKSNQENFPCAYVIAKGALDDALDSIISMANDGETNLASSFCQKLSELYPEPQFDDIRGLLSDIEHLKTFKPNVDSSIINEVEPLPKHVQGYLSARGQIVKYFDLRDGKGGNGIIVDSRSHKKLKFDATALQGPLRNSDSSSLKGSFVTYTITKDLRVKTVLPVMEIEDALDLAAGLFHDYKKQRTACDILRIALKEGYDEEVQSKYEEWKRSEEKAGRYLWDEIELQDYQAPQVPSLPIRSKAHTEMVLSFIPPKAPFIGFGDFCKKEDSVSLEESSASSEQKTEQGDRIESISQTIDHHVENVQTVPQEDSVNEITDEDINTSYEADKEIPSNSVLSFSFYQGGTIRLNNSTSDLLLCTIDDIIDEDLRLEAIKTKGSEYIREVPTVCLKTDDKKAFAICKPDTIGNMLCKARDLYLDAIAQQDEEEMEDDINCLSLLKMALGYVTHVEVYAPQNTISSQIADNIRTAIKSLSSNCYKAPAGALHYTGYVANNKGGNRRLEDMRFEGSQTPRFTIEDIVDPDYITRGINIGDELMYSVYTIDAKKYPHRARFVHRAMSEIQLLALAKDWETKGNILNAWGIAKNIQDALPESEGAKNLLEKYEKIRTNDGTFVISEELKTGRQQSITESFFKQARQAKEQGDQRKAIDLYKLALIDYKTDKQSKAQSVSDAINLFHNLYLDNLDDATLYQEYKDFGNKHLIKNSELNTFVLSHSRMRINSVKVKIIFLLDTKQYDELIDAYSELVNLIDREMRDNVKADVEKLTTDKAEAWASKAWIQLHRDQRGYAEASRYVQSAEKLQPNTEKAIISRAVCEWREKSGKDFLDKIRFSPHEITKLVEWMDNSNIPKFYFSGTKKHNLVKERFALLCRIIKSPDNSMQLLARYLGTLLYNEDKYYYDIKANKDVLPADCWVAKQLYLCIKKGINWPCWMDIRLLCMLEVRTAQLVCDLLYNIDKTYARDLAIIWNKDFKHPTIQKLPFARLFNVWRGQDFQSKYAEFLSSTEKQLGRSDIESYAEFIRDLESKEWMTQEDSDLVVTLKQQLPDLLLEYSKADCSRAIIETRKRILQNIDELSDTTDRGQGQNRINRRPTVLSVTAIVPLLERIRSVMERSFSQKKFSQPNPIANIISVSSLGEDGSMTIELEVKNNSRFALAMNDCELKLSSINASRCMTYSDKQGIYGGESLFYILEFKLPPEEQNEKQGNISAEFSYKVNGEEMKPSEFNLQYDIDTQFVKIPDPFGDTLNIAVDNFYGRDEFISDIMDVIGTPNEMPHYFFYGQKRSGKSSVLYHIKERLTKGAYLCIDANFAAQEIKREEDIYYFMLTSAVNTFRDINDDLEWNGAEEMLPMTLMSIPTRDEIVYEDFIRYFQKATKALKRTKTWEKHKIVFLIDEFTSIYRWMKEPNAVITSLFMQRWKEIQNKRLFSAVLVGQDILASFIDKTGVPNAFGVLNRNRLDYLEEVYAKKLITEPIIKASKNKKLFVGNAVNKILRYSASSAYYTRWICVETIKFIKAHRLSHITEADVEFAIREHFCQSNDRIDIFDPLTYSGQSPKESDFSQEKNTAVLEKIASVEIEKPDIGCRRADISPSEIDGNSLLREIIDQGELDNILNNLQDRGVLLVENQIYRIRVKLYLLWVMRKKYGNPLD